MTFARIATLLAFAWPAHALAAVGEGLTRWGAGTTVAVQVELEDDQLVSGAARPAAEAALATYTAELERMGSSVALTTRAPGKSDSAVSISWVQDSWSDDFQPEALAVTVTSYDPDSQVIFSSNIFVNADLYDWMAQPGDMSDCDAAFDLQSVLTHELGHLLGLHHSAAREAAMYPSLPACQNVKRRLAADDVNELEARYLEDPITAPPSQLGCSVAVGSHGSASSGIAAIAALFLFGLMRRRRGLAAAGALLLAPAIAGATTLRELSLDELGGAAVTVARGTVVAVGQREAAPGRVYTDAMLQVAECMKGRCDSTLIVRQLGGVTATSATSVEGTSELEVGSEVVVFLRPRRDGAHSLVGMAQGKFSVERGRDTLTRDLGGVTLANRDGGVREGDLERVTLDVVRRAAHRQD